MAFYSKSGPTNRGYENGNSDYNILYSDNEASGKAFMKQFQEEFGFDKNSLFTKPGFVDIENYDLRLRPDSPARALGIKAIDVEKIGLKDDPAFARIHKQGLVSTGRGNRIVQEGWEATDQH